MSQIPHASSTQGWRRLLRFVAARVDRGSLVGLRLTIGVVIFAAASWLFGGVLEDVLEKEALVRFDFALHDWAYAHTTAAGVRVFHAITQFGAPVLYAIIAVVAIMLAIRHDRFLLWSWIAANAGGVLIELAVKAGIQRQRPQLTATHLLRKSFSFPSGHAMMSVVCYITLVYVLSRTFAWPRGWTRVAYVAAGALALTIAFSRLYLGVHYPSDVLGGLAAGTAWVAAAITTMRLVERQNPVPQPLLGASRQPTADTL